MIAAMSEVPIKSQERLVRALLPAIVMAIAVFGDIASAEQAYIVDKTTVGIREGKTVSDPLLGVVDTGAKLEILERDGAFVRVRTEDALEGWLGIEYVMPEAPARDRVAELEARLLVAESALATYTESAKIQPKGELENPADGASGSFARSVVLALIGLGAGFLLGHRRSSREFPRLRGYRL